MEMARMSTRKKRIIEILDLNNPKGLATLNELRVKSLWLGHNESNTSNRGHQRKSFNRTVFEYGDPLNVLTLDNVSYVDEKLTVGLTVRWAMWYFIEKGYLSHTPPRNLSFILGRDACSAILEYEKGQYMLIGMAYFLDRIHIVSMGNNILDEEIKLLSGIQYPAMGIDGNGRMKRLQNTALVSDLLRLPTTIHLENHHEFSLGKVRSRHGYF